MADPRDSVNFDGIKPVNVTYKIDNSTITYSATEDNGSAQVGLVATLVAATAKTVELIGDGEGIEGLITQVFEDNYCSLQVGGYMQLPGGSGATLTRSKALVGDLGAASAEGYVREVNTAQAAELGVMRGRIIDPTTTTAIDVVL